MKCDTYLRQDNSLEFCLYPENPAEGALMELLARQGVKPRFESQKYGDPGSHYGYRVVLPIPVKS